MSAELLLEHLEYAAESPDAVPLVRRFILDMAVRGKLVSQNPKDETAAKLLERIVKEKKKLEKDGVIKQGKSLPMMDEKDIPFQIPDSWVWARLGDICSTQTGKKDANQGGDKGLYNFYTCAKLPIKSQTYSFEGASIILPGNGANLGFVNFVNEKFEAYQRTYVLNNFIVLLPDFVYLILLAMWHQNMGEQFGSAINYIKLGNITGFNFPLPPLAEQKRIVAKVDKLMALCDELEKRQNEREESRRRLVAGALHELKSPPQSFAKSARFVVSHFADITARPDSIKALRKTILDMAVRGKLVPQNPKDEPAAKLLERIAKEKRKLEKDGIIRQEKPLPPIDEKDIPFQIPNGWEWMPSVYPAYLISDLGKKIKTSDILQFGRFPVVDQGKVFIRGYCDDEKKVIEVNTPIILFGDHTREIKLINFNFVVGADGVKLLRLILILPRYYEIALRWGIPDSRGYGRHFKILKSSYIPLPSLSEQKRIVAKVDKLMALCDKLESSLTATQENRRRLLVSLLRADSLDGKNGANG